MDEKQRSLMLGPGEGRLVPVGASWVRFLAVGDDTGGRSSAEEIGVPAGFAGPPPHYHNQTNHSWYVVEGELRLTVADEQFDVAPGGFLYVPIGTSHTFANPGSRHARMVQFTTPGGFERYLEELAEAFPAGTDVDPQRIIEIMARYDTFPTRAV
jgi:mannose-6-phosphate isomerase-like protein (cupin superfamily)